MGHHSFIASLFSMTDEQAMWRLQTQDDHAAFAQLVDRWGEPILRLCGRMTGDPHRGEDLKQEAFARVFAKRKDFRPGAKFSTWLWRLALNLCYDELRKTQRRGERPLDGEQNDEGLRPLEYATDAPDPCENLVREEEDQLVRQALLRLPEPQRTVLVLRYCEGLKLREIAEILDLPETTVSSRVAVGLALLTRILEPQFDQRPLRPGKSVVTSLI